MASTDHQMWLHPTDWFPSDKGGIVSPPNMDLEKRNYFFTNTVGRCESITTNDTQDDSLGVGGPQSFSANATLEPFDSYSPLADFVDDRYAHWSAGPVGNSHKWLISYAACSVDADTAPANGNWMGNVAGFTCRIVNYTSDSKKKLNIRRPILRYINIETGQLFHYTCDSFAGQATDWASGSSWSGTESSGDSSWQYRACWIGSGRTEDRRAICDPNLRFMGIVFYATNGDAGAGVSAFRVKIADWRPIILSGDRARVLPDNLTKTKVVIPVVQPSEDLDGLKAAANTKQVTGDHQSDACKPIFYPVSDAKDTDTINTTDVAE